MYPTTSIVWYSLSLLHKKLLKQCSRQYQVFLQFIRRSIYLSERKFFLSILNEQNVQQTRFHPLNGETNDVIVPTRARVLPSLCNDTVCNDISTHTRKGQIRIKQRSTHHRRHPSLTSVCAATGVPVDAGVSRENTGQEGDSHERAHRSLGDYDSLVQGVAPFTASRCRSSKITRPRSKTAYLGGNIWPLVINASRYRKEKL